MRCVGPPTQVLCLNSAVECTELLQKKCRVDALLSVQFPTVSRERIKSSIQGGNMSVNSVVRTKPSFSCNVGDVVRFSIPARPETVAEPENIPIDIFYEDSDVLVINKAAGMLLSNRYANSILT